MKVVLDTPKQVLAKKREITESRLAYARSVNDRTLIAMNEKQLAQITRWEAEYA